MAILIVDSGPYTDIPLLLKETKQELVLLTDDKFTGSTEGYVYVEKFLNFETNTNVIIRALELAKLYKFTSVIAFREGYILPAAIIRDRLGIPGQTGRSALMFRDKLKMKEVACHSVEVPVFQRIKHPIDVYDFIQKHNFPVVVKPISGVTSSKTYVIRSYEDLALLYQNVPLFDFEVEKYMESTIYTVDGFINNGELVMTWIARYVNDCLSFKEGKGVSRVELELSNPLSARLYDFVKQLFKTMELPYNTTFHLEVFHTLDDHLVLCEVASRTGGNTDYITQAAYNLSITEVSIQAQCGLTIETDWKKRNNMLFGYMTFPPKNKTLDYIPESLPFPWVSSYTLRGKPGTTYKLATNSADRLATAVIEGRSEVEIIARMEETNDWFNQHCKWR